MKMNQIEDRKAAISARTKEHYNYLIAAGYDVVFTALQGSQNYGLDEYSDNYCSDVDTKSIILPSLGDFINARTPVSTVEILDNEEHAEVKDIRIMFEMFRKENISYIELLYSDYIVFNPKYEELIKPLFNRRDDIVAADITSFLKCIAGMAYEKDKVLCHPYPSMMDKIEKYGYDGKQLSHCYRLLIFMLYYSMGKPISACYKPDIVSKEAMMNFKKQLDIDGSLLTKERAIKLSTYYVKIIKELKDSLIKEHDYGVNEDVWVFLNEIKAKILKFKITEEVLNKIIVYLNEEFKKRKRQPLNK